jgi:hypothetical protein
MAVNMEFGEYLALLRSNAEWFCDVYEVPFRPDLLAYISELEGYVDRTARKQIFGRKGFDKWFSARRRNPYFYVSKYKGWDPDSR